MQLADWWSYQCPSCDEVFQADRNELKQPWWSRQPPALHCPECSHKFAEDQAVAMQRYKGTPAAVVSRAPEPRRDYLFHIVTGVLVSLITAVILAILGLRN